MGIFDLASFATDSLEIVGAVGKRQKVHLIAVARDDELGRFILGKSFGSLEKAIDILCLFESEHLELSAQEISKNLSIPLSTTYKYLQVLKQKQFLSKNEQTNQFYLGLMILKLGLFAAQKTSVMKIATPYLKLLADRSLETAVLTVADGPNAICVDIVESPRAVKFITARGNTMPLYAGSPGKIILAFKDPSFIDHLIQTTGLAKLNKNTITDGEQLKKELAFIRKQGFSESDSEFQVDVCSVAAPIFDYKGQINASISVGGPAERIFLENKQSLIDLVKDCAKKISSELGYGGSQEERKLP